MPMLREVGDVERYPYLAGLGLDRDDAGRLDLATGAADHGGFFVNAETGETRLLATGDAVPAGTWIAQRDIDAIRPGPGAREEPHGFGEGWGAQGEQLGGDRSYPEEDAGGTRRVPHGPAEGTSADPSVSDAASAGPTEAGGEAARRGERR